jgi:hypothetical protein
MPKNTLKVPRCGAATRGVKVDGFALKFDYYLTI